MSERVSNSGRVRDYLRSRKEEKEKKKVWGEMENELFREASKHAPATPGEEEEEEEKKEEIMRKQIYCTQWGSLSFKRGK